MKPQLHVSGMNMLFACGEQYRRRYIEGEKIPPSGAIIRGIAVDASANADLTSKLQTGELLPEEQLIDLAADTVRTKWAEGVYEVGEDEPQTEGAVVDVSVKLAQFHHRGVAPTIEPAHVQRAWSLEIVGLPVDLAGTIDLQDASGAIRDLKTASKSPNARAAEDSLQLTTYALARQVLDATGPMVHPVGLDVLVCTPKKQETKYVQLQSTRQQSDFEPFIERVMAATRAMESGIFTPAREDDWRCSEKFCGYWRTCRYARKPKQFQIGEPK